MKPPPRNRESGVMSILHIYHKRGLFTLLHLGEFFDVPRAWGCLNAHAERHAPRSVARTEMSHREQGNSPSHPLTHSNNNIKIN
eukprot:6938986-Pyramimonas_sp.AAC.1